MATSTSSLKPGEMSEILQNEIDHIIYLPKGYETETKTPAILFLHGAGGVNGGFDNIMKAYKIAIQKKYRFHSYGDAMLIL